MNFIVDTRVWLVGGYSLKKDDVITVKQKNAEARTLLIDNIYFENPIWVFIDDLLTHCKIDDSIPK